MLCVNRLKAIENREIQDVSFAASMAIVRSTIRLNTGVKINEHRKKYSCTTTSYTRVQLSSFEGNLKKHIQPEKKNMEKFSRDDLETSFQKMNLQALTRGVRVAVDSQLFAFILL